MFHLGLLYDRLGESSIHRSFTTYDITALEQDFLQPWIDIIKSFNMFLVYSLVLFIGIDWRIGIIISITSFISVFIPKIFSKKLKISREIYQGQLAKYIVKITDILEGFKLINHATIDNIEHSHNNELEKVANKRYAFGKNKSFTLSVSLFFTKLVKIISFIFIIILFYQKQITIGTSIATLSFVSVLIEPIDSILYDVTTIQSVKKIKETYTDFIKYEKISSAPIDQINRSLNLKNIKYNYDDFELKNINLDFIKGKKYLITGDSGSGKSTLLKIIAGYLNLNDGYIEIDGKKTNGYDYSGLIGYIAQKEHIFNDDVYNNITVYNSYEYNHAKYQNISNKINQIYTSKIENPQKMSGGEKQIISLLRLFAKKADILLMDEPFSAIDYNLNKKIIHYITNDVEFEDKIIIIISHHIDNQLLNYFDYKIFMQNGEVKSVNYLN